jgi:agmatine/peptidylarginine deiminase
MKKNKPSDGGKESGRSLNKTITEILEFMERKEKRPAATSGELRNFMKEKMGDLCVLWYKRGFNRGHTESHSAFLSTKTVPSKLEYTAVRTFYRDQKRQVPLSSKVRPAKNPTRK